MFEREAGNPRLRPVEQIDRFFEILDVACPDPGSRGSPFINFGIEFPTRDHPARGISPAHRQWMKKIAAEMAAWGGADAPAAVDATLSHLHDVAMVGNQLAPAGSDAT
jgi:hypothetical protein